MKKKDRHDKILEILETQVSVETVELSNILDVSAMTIRRDFNQLEEKGLITIVHGGAMINSYPSLSRTLYRGNDLNNKVKEKKNIGEAAASLIKEGDVVFIDAGSTTKELSLVLREKENITVVTNSILVLNALSMTDSSSKLIVLPGTFQKTSMAIFGGLTNRTLEDFTFDIAFIGAMGITRNSVTVDNFEEGVTKAKFIERSKKSVLLADSSKINLSYAYNINLGNGLDVLITSEIKDKNKLSIKKDLRNQFKKIIEII